MKPETQSKQNDPARWIDLYGDYLLSVAMMKVSHRETAEDLVQETFLSAIKARDTFRGNSSEKTWLLSILRNKIIDHYRKKDVLKESDSYLESTEDSFYDGMFHSSTGHWLKEAAPREWEAGADAATERSEFYRTLQHCLSKLPSKIGPVFTAKFIDDQEPDNICKEFDISSSNYWVILHRAKSLMRRCLEINWFVK